MLPMKHNDTEILTALPARLLPWFAQNKRALPWRADREPYHVWLSEIMLQQTRVEAARGYYTRFLQTLPNVASLAAASPDTLNKLWEGLGYYTRVRNLQAAAKEIMSTHSGVFPTDFAAIRALPGIGDYTAGAIASICFEQPTPAVDGNVLRVFARLLADPRPVTDEATRRAVRAVLAEVYPAGHCGDFTQALMELGATVCVPNGAPDCAGCPLRDLCRSQADGGWQAYPVRPSKKARRVEELTVFVLTCDGKSAIRRRPEQGLLAGLWEFPNVPGLLDAQAALHRAEEWGVHPRQLLRQVGRTHVFTHVQWQMRCFYIECAAASPQLLWADEAALDGAYALPTAFRQFREHTANHA